MKQKTFFLLLLIALLLPIHSGIAQKLKSPFKSRVVVVQFHDGIMVGSGAAKANLAKFDHTGTKYDVHRIERVFPFLDHVDPTPRIAKNLFALRRTYYVYYGADADPEQVSRDLSSSPGVVYAEPVPVNRIHRHKSVTRIDPDDPKYQEQTYLNLVRLPEAWDIVKAEDASEPVVIAIVDNGADWQHEDLVANVWTNEDEIADNGIDDDQNGFIDDRHGANFGNADDTNNDPMGRTVGNDHGTPVASVAGAVTNNAKGISGSAWNAQLMHINTTCQVEEAGEVDEICNGYGGILYAASNGADIINTSWGFLTEDRELRMVIQSLDLATDMGALVVAGAGNHNLNADGGLGYPESHPRVLTVGATKRDSRERASFSQYGKTVDVFAPGVNILTAMPDDEYSAETGTSFSAPLVSGIAALIKTRYPDISPDSLREQLRLSSENIDTQNPSHAGYLGRGFVNAEASVQPPTLPAVRVKRWSWEDRDGNREIAPGDEVTITATMVNYLADAQQLTIELIEAEPYPYITMLEAAQSVGFLGGGDSTKVTFRFSVSTDVPPSRKPRLYVRIRDGAFMDEADAFQFFGVNQKIDLLHTAFKTLYQSTEGDSWTNNSGWDINTVPTVEQMAGWHGVVSARGHIDGLNLKFNNLRGSIPSNLGPAPGLTVLALPRNFISGPIPSDLAQLSDLELLDLEGNTLTGPIPPELSQLSNLRELNLAGNFLNGEIPLKLIQLSNLDKLNLAGNSLNGEIPSELSQLSSLGELNLAGNSFNGKIPSELSQLSNLEELDLSENSLSGEVPPELGQLSELIILDLSDNALTGRIPRSFLQLKLYAFSFDGQKLCAPEDDAFQGWLKGISFVSGPTCGVGTAISEEETSLPENFTVLGNYPNPFQETTRLTFDLPWQSQIHVEVIDIVGRQVLTVPNHTVEAGWGKSIELNGNALSPGLYLYRLTADSPSEHVIQTGRFVRTR